MIQGHTVCVVMPAYNAELTVRQTYDDLPKDVVDRVLLVDDQSSDETVRVAREIGIQTFRHKRNRGYGGNQKTCYREALRGGEDIVIMVHPDYQYAPRLVTAMASLIATGEFDVVLGSRILGGRSPPGRNALVQVHLEPLPDPGRELAARLQALRVSHRVPRLQPQGAGEPPPPGELRRLRLRQRDAGADHPARLPHRGSDLSDPLFPRSVQHQLRAQRPLRLRRLYAAWGGFLDRTGIYTPRFLRANGRRLGDGDYAEVVDGAASERS